MLFVDEKKLRSQGATHAARMGKANRGGGNKVLSAAEKAERLANLQQQADGVDTSARPKTTATGLD